MAIKLKISQSLASRLEFFFFFFLSLWPANLGQSYVPVPAFSALYSINVFHVPFSNRLCYMVLHEMYIFE